MVEQEEAASEVPFDIIGLSGTQQTGSSVLRLQKSAHTIFFSDSTGLLVNKRWADCCSFYTVSERVSFTDVTMVSGYLRVIQVYAPTTAHTDDEYYEFLDHVMEALNARSSASSRKKCTKIVIGDFNAMVGCGNAEEQYIGPYGLGVHNQRGNILAHFCCETHLHVMNNHFQKKRISRKWTWIFPNMKTKNAIDYVLSEDPAIFLDIDIIGRFRFTSDHCLVMAKIRLRNRRCMFKRSQPRSTLNMEAFSSALGYLATSTDLSNYEQLKRAIALAAMVHQSK
ncbi:hypothetical protein Y032_0243g3470 [Ancylostoma ceylanicum]|uniref:Endonuclease/exonuclease/phosphatase domain-containing protein n=1 Tax=Ancylostoma ceylanicum TaxID=53326 RepID=A0A016SDC9_9BILA|nr:hypothetical protein Y032_0243g3470 [Ancylostoma ceylanicum]